MTTYLLLWNPKLFPTERLSDEIAQNRSRESVAVRWNVGNSRIQPGDRAFMMRVRTRQGIIGAGWISSSPVRRPSWDPRRAARGNTQLFVDVVFDQLSELPLIPYDELKQPPFAGYRWGAQMSGVVIPEDFAAALESRWATVIRGEHDWLASRAAAPAR